MGRKKLFLDKRKVKRWAMRLGYTALAKKMGCSMSGMRSYLIRHNIPHRDMRTSKTIILTSGLEYEGGRLYV